MFSADKNQLPTRTPEQRDHDKAAVLRYRKGPYEIADADLKLRNMVYEAAEVERLYNAESYAECREMCHEFLRAEGGSEAVQAKIHTYLAGEHVGSEDAALRAAHAATAIEKWTVVIERTGTSRFPIDEARQQQAAARSILVALQALAVAEDEPSIDPALRNM